jgi:hypothetical protein
MIKINAYHHSNWSGYFFISLLLVCFNVSSATLLSDNNHSPSQESRRLANWIIHNNNNQNFPYIIIDKTEAVVSVFNQEGKLLGATPALLGLRIGDKINPDTKNKPLNQISPEERITPAGRFFAQLGKNASNHIILWVDYENAISLHSIRSANAKERRGERLATPSAEDNRISYGCINVPKEFFNKVVKPSLRKDQLIVYIIPEQLLASSFFEGYSDFPDN